MKALEVFARLIGLQTEDEGVAVDALRSERAARLVLSRRALIASTAVLAAGTAFSFPMRRPDASVVLMAMDGSGRILERWYRGDRINYICAYESTKLVRSSGSLILRMETPPGAGCIWYSMFPIIA